MLKGQTFCRSSHSGFGIAALALIGLTLRFNSMARRNTLRFIQEHLVRFMGEH
jgi:hypothetical protein